MVQLQAAPYKSQSDDYLAVASSFSLLMVFFCSIIYKYDALTASADLRAKMSIEQTNDYIVDNTLLSAILILSVFGALIGLVSTMAGYPSRRRLGRRRVRQGRNRHTTERSEEERALEVRQAIWTGLVSAYRAARHAASGGHLPGDG